MSDDNKTIIEALSRAKNGSEILATGVTSEQMRDLVDKKQIGQMEAARIRQLLETTDDGWWIPKSKKLADTTRSSLLS